MIAFDVRRANPSEPHAASLPFEVVKVEHGGRATVERRLLRYDQAVRLAGELAELAGVENLAQGLYDTSNGTALLDLVELRPTDKPGLFHVAYIAPDGIERLEGWGSGHSPRLFREEDARALMGHRVMAGRAVLDRPTPSRRRHQRRRHTLTL